MEYCKEWRVWYIYFYKLRTLYTEHNSKLSTLLSIIFKPPITVFVDRVEMVPFVDLLADLEHFCAKVVLCSILNGTTHLSLFRNVSESSGKNSTPGKYFTWHCNIILKYKSWVVLDGIDNQCKVRGCLVQTE